MTWEPIVQNLLSKADLLIVFIGMLTVVWRSLTIAHDLAQRALSQSQPLPQPIPVQPTIAHPSTPTKPPAASTPTPPAPTITPSDAVTPGLVDFIKKAEGFSAKAYWDYKQWSIGYGTKANSPTETITESEAIQRLTDEIHKADKLITDKYGTNLPLGQHQALLDLTYNAGSGWEESSLGHAVEIQKIDTIKADILLYNHAGGQVNDGLTKRRETEITWFDNPI